MKRFLAVGLFLLAAGCAKSPQEKIDQAYRRGLAQLDAYQFDPARSSFDEIKKIDSVSPLVPYGYALAEEREFKLLDAVNSYMNVVSVRRDFAPAWGGLARVYTILGVPEDAVSAARKCAELVPRDFKARLLYVDALIRNRQYDRAWLELTKAETSADTAAVVDLVKARILQARNLPDSAEILQKPALAQPLSTPEFYAAAADCLEQAGLIDSAMSFSRKSWQAAGSSYDDMIAHFFRALRTRYLFDGRQVIGSAVAHGANDFVRAAMYRFYYQLGAVNPVKARAAGDELRILAPENMTVLVLATQTGGIAGLTKDIDADLLAVRSAFEQGHYSKEFQTLAKYFLAMTYSRSRQAADAISRLEELGAEYARRRVVALTLARLNRDAGNTDKFTQTMTQLAEKYKDSAIWLTGMGDIYATGDAAGRTESEKLYRQALTVDPWSRPAVESLARFYDEAGRYADQLKVYDEYPHFEARFPDMAVGKAVCLVENEKIPEGLALFKEKIKYLRGCTDMYVPMIRMLDGKARPSERAEVVRTLVDLNADNDYALVLAAGFESDAGNYARALELVERVSSRSTGDLQVQVEKARALYWTGRKDEAYSQLETVLQKDINHPDANYYLSNFWAREKVNLSRAENLARRALFESDRSARYTLNISFVYFQAGRYDLSRGEAMKAGGISPDNPEVSFRYGMALHMEGKKEAKEFLRKAVNLGLSGDDLRVAQEILAKR